MPRKFLTAAWRDLVMLNYEIDPAVLRPLVPPGTELDTFNGRHLVSVVGFRFLDLRWFGLPVPFHRNFEEVNLRFYVRHRAEEGWRRGVVFIKEVVPKVAVSFGARWFYNEKYVTCPMSHETRRPDAAAGTSGLVVYRWVSGQRTNVVRAEFSGPSAPLTPGSEEEFVTEHYWGYVVQRNGDALEYRVEHPSWRVWQATAASFDCDVRGFYGDTYLEALERQPSSAFVVDGSEVAVYSGQRLPRVDNLHFTPPSS